MKNILTIIAILFAASASALGQTRISGKVYDDLGPLAGVNVFILGSIEGAVSDTSGCFSFVSSRKGEQTLVASMLGYEDYRKVADVTSFQDLDIRMRLRSATIDEVVVCASTFSMGKSYQFKSMDAIDVVLSGNSCGDVVAAMQSLPGTQKVGENGRLYVRGGESWECQTYVNGMHVLVPYSTNVEGQSQRGRFSPFLFKGMSFSLGGYSGEYGQALSSVLPMETTDVAGDDKLGVSASLVDWNLGGTKAFKTSSLSFNAAYTDLHLYNALFPDRVDWTRPYGKFAAEAQYKMELSRGGEMKSYAGYDYTSVGMNTEGRGLSLGEHNVYANAVVRTGFGKGYSFFAGAAESMVLSDIQGAMVAGDHYHNRRNEVHLKAEIKKSVSPLLKLSAGVEDYIRNSTTSYEATGYDLAYNVAAAHMDANVRVVPKLFLNVSVRGENVDYDNEWIVMPRATLSFVPGGKFQTSLMFGRYSQSPEDDYIARRSGKLFQSIADHAILSLQYSTSKTVFRLEPYYKKYSKLPLLSGGLYSSDGYGLSRGLDIFLEDASLIKNLSVTAAYSFNDSERLYLDFDAPRAPEYASRHNFRLSFKYGIGKSIIGLADSYASPRSFAAGKTPYYNSLDANWTYLPHPKVIIYASLNNILGRTNVYRIKPDGSQMAATRDRFFYLGIMISLKNKNAYDVSNF